MKKKVTESRDLFPGFMDEYTGKAEARRVREETIKSKKAVPPAAGGHSLRTLALEAENARLREELRQQSRPVLYVTNAPSDFEREYNRPETVEEAPKGRKIVLDDAE